MGGIDLDPASSDRAQELVQAAVYYTKDDDGLTRPWSGRVWMNPPYSKGLIWPFCERLCDFVASGDVTEAIVLVNNATETAAFQRMAEIAGAMCFHAKRIRFLNRDLEPAETPVQGQAFIYFGPNVDAFRAEFEAFGFTVTL
jgi:ParB family chromosome partitioning protein